jgi:hypothetical protein
MSPLRLSRQFIRSSDSFVGQQQDECASLAPRSLRAAGRKSCDLLPDLREGSAYLASTLDDLAKSAVGARR